MTEADSKEVSTIATRVCAVSVPGLSVSEVGVEVLNEEMVIEDWQKALRELLKLHDASIAIQSIVQFGVGDMLLFGERKYGEMYAQALDHTDMKYGTLANWVFVARKVPREIRRSDVSWAHHREVAALKDADGNLSRDDQVKWLSRAALNGWSSYDLKREMERELRQEFISALPESEQPMVRQLVASTDASCARLRELKDEGKLEDALKSLEESRPEIEEADPETAFNATYEKIAMVRSNKKNTALLAWRAGRLFQFTHPDNKPEEDGVKP